MSSRSKGVLPTLFWGRQKIKGDESACFIYVYQSSMYFFCNNFSYPSGSPLKIFASIIFEGIDVKLK
ncbi:hypothetical protein BJP41_06160 [Candidatus Williamhamiltonella defendens]|uniref:Uncharacterized protein n=1 Tax=Candidatus Williamhamiltonella defendens TaxID=138072 RepID=A0A2D3T379_9ENTR|nr:hypothetical protein CJJ18_03205 [Candidatus Hamiltonella defensa]ATW29981.1 hypothetical protein BJP41_06160 [Candidatus Hamiltonella defensa]